MFKKTFLLATLGLLGQAKSKLSK